MNLSMKYIKLFILSLLFLLGVVNCTSEKTEDASSNKLGTIDSLALEKKERIVEAKILESKVDSLKKYLDSLKAIQTDTLK